MLATQDKTAWAASPWREDPYHTVVSLAQFAVPMFALVIALRLLAWRAPGVAAWARRRAMTVFVALSAVAAAAVTGFQAVGERWTDPPPSCSPGSPVRLRRIAA